MTDKVIVDTNGRPLVVGDLCFMSRSYISAVIGVIVGFKDAIMTNGRSSFKETRVIYRQYGESKNRTISAKKILVLEPFYNLTLPGDKIDAGNINQRKDIAGKLLRTGHIVATNSRLQRTNVRLMMIEGFGPRGGVLHRPLTKDEYNLYAPNMHQRRGIAEGEDSYAGDFILVLNDSLRETLFRLRLTQ